MPVVQRSSTGALGGTVPLGLAAPELLRSQPGAGSSLLCLMLLFLPSLHGGRGRSKGSRSQFGSPACPILICLKRTIASQEPLRVAEKCFLEPVPVQPPEAPGEMSLCVSASPHHMGWEGL